jgi:alpha-N-acetylglucosamine transferase
VVNIDHEEVTQWQHSPRYPAIANANNPRLSSFVKLLAWKMVQYENIFYFDADTEIRSNLTEYFLTLPKGRDAVISNITTHRCGFFFNAGVMVVRHSSLGLVSPQPYSGAVCRAFPHAARHPLT